MANRIGFIGLGIMGSRMALRLADAGQHLTVYNRTRNKAEPLLQKGAQWADSPAVLARECEMVITMLSSPQAVDEVALGENGLLPNLKPGSMWIDCSTIDPSSSLKFAGFCHKHKIRFADAPVAGSIIPAEKGELTFLFGGEEADYQEVKPILELMGKNIQHLGPAGKGTATKMVINLMLAQSMLAFSESLNLGEKLGLEKGQLMKLLLNAPVTAPFLKLKESKFLNGDFEVEFPMKHMVKDLQLALNSGYETGASLSMAAVSKEMYQLASNYGLGEEDFSAVYSFLQGHVSGGRDI